MTRWDFTDASAEIELELNGEFNEYEISFSFDYTPERPGNIHGLPENCYPFEPEDYEFGDIKIKIADNLWVTPDDESVLEEALVSGMRNVLEIEYEKAQKDNGN
jgi:hypothetical protein